MDDQPVAGYSKRVFTSDCFSDFHDFITCKLEQLLTPSAVKVVVLWIAIIVLVNGTSLELEAPQQASIYEFFERSIDGRPAYVVRLTLAGQLLD